jgi:HAD superfamily hydrolase (TIGR01509 family)
MSRFKAIIFDCDGVLMDSEILFCARSAADFTKAGYPISTEEYIERNMGRSRKDFSTELAQRGIHVDVPEDVKTILADPAFRSALKATPYAREVVSSLTLPYAIASGSSAERLADTLEIVGLYDLFAGRIFSAESVAHPKPAPDIFLYAAQQLGVAPKDCLVVEDGVNGTLGALAAGMVVWGYTAASHMIPPLVERLRRAGVERLFGDLRELLTL